ncbi:hypothetical protein [Confluentibacter flavum]|uniref:Lysoplasmalogenase n=1 Tax=Confluentibacter flavum TaxID=1909700 RepID=A0A2N3HIU2_9FLAO|nr:hypothetical protein [Confluentibacter flavum]PKQ44861.1 hypothetical protein CSW08_11145 [Confluentibacter flavum]
MNKSIILVGTIVLIYTLFVIFQFGGNELIAYNLRSLIFPFVALTYFISIREKSIFFNLFLIFYSLSELLAIISDKLSPGVDYLLGNSLYILAYLMLFIKICKSISLMHVLKNFKIHLVVLTALNIYIVYVMQIIIDPLVELNYEYFVELIYNIVMLLLLSSSLINYFYRDNKKSLYLFVGSLCIVFSEVISVAYLYVAKQDLLNFIAVSLALIAFYFFYQQSKLGNEESINNNMLID